MYILYKRTNNIQTDTGITIECNIGLKGNKGYKINKGVKGDNFKEKQENAGRRWIVSPKISVTSKDVVVIGNYKKSSYNKGNFLDVISPIMFSVLL